MKLADIDNIWSADLNLLSNADRGRVAKIINTSRGGLIDTGRDAVCVART